MGARWVGSWASVLAAVSVRSRHAVVQSQGNLPPGSERPAGWGSAFPRVGCWGASASGAVCGQAAPVRAHQAEPRGWARPGSPAWPAWGAVAAGGWARGSEPGCRRTSEAQAAARRYQAGPGPGLGAEWEEKGSQWQLALVTHWVCAAQCLGNSGPQHGQKVGFLVLGGREQVS